MKISAAVMIDWAIGDAALLVHRSLAQQRIRVFLGERLRAHQDALGAVDDLAFLERRLAGLRQFRRSGAGLM